MRRGGGGLKHALEKRMGKESISKKDIAPAKLPGSKMFKNTATWVKIIRLKKIFSYTTT